ncbi:MAG: SAM-dependent methyltransferase, partial [Propionibacteriaceae bacterium]
SSVWDMAGGGGPLSLFWAAAHDLDPAVRGEEDRAGGREGELAQLSEAAGLSEVESFALTVELRVPSREDWWEPYTLGVGPAGAYVSGLDTDARGVA